VNLAIHWNFNPQIINGYDTPNYYGLLFITGLMLGYTHIKRTFKSEHVPEKYLDKLLIFVLVGTIVGARLGHVFFYDWDKYKNDLISIFKTWEGGLASHGGAIALLIMLWIYSKYVVKQPVLWILDRISAPIALAGTFIRLGNLANGEIVGKPTSVPWGFKFMRNDCYFPEMNCDWSMIPTRHPAQIYEAICYIVIFFILRNMYRKKHLYLQQGKIFGWFLVLLWSARFLVEGLKEGQTARDAEMLLNTGQMLSIPLILLGVYLLFIRKAPKVELPQF
jgi:prolipoprotein diacylglyceryl transferase